MKRNIFDLCTDTKDCYLAVIEVSCAAVISGFPKTLVFFLGGGVALFCCNTKACVVMHFSTSESRLNKYGHSLSTL